MVKTINWIQCKKMNRSKKNGDKDGIALWRLMNNAIYQKKMENLRNRFDVRFRNNDKYYLKWTSKPSYMSHKIFDNNLVTICKSKVTLMLNKPTYIGMCILEMSKVLMYKFHYDYIKSKYDNNSKLLFTDTNSIIYEYKTEKVYEDFSSDKEMFDFNNCVDGILKIVHKPKSKLYVAFITSLLFLH